MLLGCGKPWKCGCYLGAHRLGAGGGSKLSLSSSVGEESLGFPVLVRAGPGCSLSVGSGAGGERKVGSAAGVEQVWKQVLQVPPHPMPKQHDFF